MSLFRQDKAVFGLRQHAGKLRFRFLLAQHNRVTVDLVSSREPHITGRRKFREKHYRFSSRNFSFFSSETLQPSALCESMTPVGSLRLAGSPGCKTSLGIESLPLRLRKSDPRLGQAMHTDREISRDHKLPDQPRVVMSAGPPVRRRGCWL